MTLFNWLFNDAVSITGLFGIDGNGDCKVLFGKMSPRIRHRLSDIWLMVGEIVGKPQSGNQLKQESKPSLSATPAQQANALLPVAYDDRYRGTTIIDFLSILSFRIRDC